VLHGEVLDNGEPNAGAPFSLLRLLSPGKKRSKIQS
jgi:hypothetical protein